MKKVGLQVNFYDSLNKNLHEYHKQYLNNS